jgi:hypothetical protein
MIFMKGVVVVVIGHSPFSYATMYEDPIMFY